MIVSEEIARQILSGKRLMLRLPAKARCPYKPNGVYVIQTARGAPARCHITIDAVEPSTFEDQPVWVLRFRKGDHTDTPRLLAAKWSLHGGDYTDIPSRALSGSSEEVGPQTQAIYAARSLDGVREAKNGSYGERIQRLGELVREIGAYAPDPRTSERLRGIERQVASLQRRLDVI